MMAIVLDAYGHIRMPPAHRAFYTVMQCSDRGTKLFLYVLYQDRPAMYVATVVKRVVSDAVTIFTMRAVGRLTDELKYKRVPPRWQRKFENALANIQNGSLQLGINTDQEQTRAIEGRNDRIWNIPP